MIRWLLYPPVFLLIALLPGIWTWFALPAAQRPPKSIHAIRWFLGMVFLISGIAKLLPGFPNSMGPTNLEAVLAVHGLGMLGRFVAVGEVAIGFLLLTRRFATIGAIALGPMLIGILITVTSLNWQGTPYVVSGLLVFDLILLAYDHPKLLPLIGERSGTLPASDLVQRYRSIAVWGAGLAVLLLVLAMVRVPAATTASVSTLLVSLVALAVLDWRSTRS